jgi:TatD DNase family protein
MQLIDIGVNLANKRLLRDVDQVIAAAGEAGVEQMIVTGTSLEHSQQALDLCTRFPGKLFATAGIHPHEASTWNAQSQLQMATLCEAPAVRAVGETGLDFNRNFSPRDAQIEAFEGQMELAATTGLPLFLHQRDALPTFIPLLGQYRDRVGRVVVHCFTDDRQALHTLLDLDCHIGVTGWICDERRGGELRESIVDIPPDRLMIETDAPYLLPRDLPDPPSDKTNRPHYLPHILARIAQLRGDDPHQLARDIHQTTREFFAI